jgi:hypothetical protein
MTTETQRIANGSTLVRLVHATMLQLRAWFGASWLASTSRTITNAFEVATGTSGLAGISRAIVRWTRQSYLYGWLTKEPNPDVVVIDLRETYTIGPFIALLDRLSPVFERTWRGSVAFRVTERLRSSSKWECITDSKTVQLLAAALEPPEPPDENHRK